MTLAAVAVIGMIALAGVGIYFVTREVNVRSATPASAAQEFDAARARFSNQQPVLSIRDDEVMFEGEMPERPSREPRAPDVLRVLVWDADEEKLVRVNVPFWLLRFSRRSSFSVSSDGFDLNRLKLTVNDLERLGPALLLDHRERGGTRVLLWTE